MVSRAAIRSMRLEWCCDLFGRGVRPEQVRQQVEVAVKCSCGLPTADGHADSLMLRQLLHRPQRPQVYHSKVLLTKVLFGQMYYKTKVLFGTKIQPILETSQYLRYFNY